MVGKRVGTRIYVHVNYADRVINSSILQRAARFALAEGIDVRNCTAVRYDTRDHGVAFQWSPDFDEAEEPTVGDTVLVRPGGRITITRQRADPQIWHHKWMWVGPGYLGFDWEESRARSTLWAPYVRPSEKLRIGTRSYWDKIRTRWE
jgi:hypothetical protein